MIFDALITSIKICVISLCISFFLSFIFSLYFSEKNNMVKKILEGIIIFPMFLPPSAVGYGLLLVFSKGSFIGKLLYETFNTSIIFTLSGAVIASVIISFPLMYKGMKGALLEINSEIKDSARDLGAKEWQVFTKISFPLSLRGIYGGVLLSGARIIGEFGATIIIAGNIPNKTQTLPIALYYAIESNNRKEGEEILLLMILISLVLIILYNIAISKKGQVNEKN